MQQKQEYINENLNLVAKALNRKPNPFLNILDLDFVNEFKFRSGNLIIYSSFFNSGPKSHL